MEHPCIGREMYVSEDLITSEIAPKQVLSMMPILPLPIFTTPEAFFGIDYAESGRDILSKMKVIWCEA